MSLILIIQVPRLDEFRGPLMTETSHTFPGVSSPFDIDNPLYGFCFFSSLLFIAQRYGASRNNSANSVFINHLSYGVAKQNDILVERFDLSLQFDTVHQIDGNRGYVPYEDCLRMGLVTIALCHCFSPNGNFRS